MSTDLADDLNRLALENEVHSVWKLSFEHWLTRFDEQFLFLLKAVLSFREFRSNIPKYIQ